MEKGLLPLTDSANSLLKGERISFTPSEAWNRGTNLKAATKHQEVRMWLMVEVGKLIKDVDAKKTIDTDESLAFTCRAILEEHPTLKMEELVIIFNDIRMGKFGKLYERLKTAEILECIRQYEGDTRAEIMERNAHQQKMEYQKKSDRRFEPLNLAALLDNCPDEEPKGQGIGTQLRNRMGWDK